MCVVVTDRPALGLRLRDFLLWFVGGRKREKHSVCCVLCCIAVAGLMCTTLGGDAQWDFFDNDKRQQGQQSIFCCPEACMCSDLID